MDPFTPHNPLVPYGLPGDPMDDVLSLQAYEYENHAQMQMMPIDTIGCTTVGCTTVGCTVGC